MAMLGSRDKSDGVREERIDQGKGVRLVIFAICWVYVVLLGRRHIDVQLRHRRTSARSLARAHWSQPNSLNASTITRPIHEYYHRLGICA